MTWVMLMKRAGYETFCAQGGDLGGGVANVMAKQAPPELIAIHVNFPATVPPDTAKPLQDGDPPPASVSDDERQAYEQLASAAMKRRAYAQEMGTRPQTRYGLSESPWGWRPGCSIMVTGMCSRRRPLPRPCSGILSTENRRAR